MTTPEWRKAAKAQEDGWDEPEDVAAKSMHRLHGAVCREVVLAVT